MSALGRTVRLRREELGLGQERLAAALGVRQQTVSRWEHGLAVPRPGRVVALAQLLDVDPATLHHLAGYLPAAPPAPAPVPPVVPGAHDWVSALSRDELLALVDRAWAELRARDDAPAAAVAG